MFKINNSATRLYAPASDDGAADGAQGVENRIAAALFPAVDDGQLEEEALAEDDEVLPEGKQAESKEKPEDDEVVNEDDDEVTLASMLGIDEDKLEYDDKGAVVFNAIIDGKQEKVPFAELVKSYQLQGHVNNKSMQLETEKKEFATTRDSAYNELTVRLNGLKKLNQVAREALTADYQGIDWNALRAADPGEWAALQQQFQLRLSKIQEIEQLAGQEEQRISTEKQQQMTQANQQRVAGELQKMVVDNPTWSDQAVMVKDFGEIGAFLRSTYGFTDEEVANNLDARLMRLIQDARQFHSGKVVAEKKVKKDVPKFVKPSTNGDRPSLVKARQVKATKDSIRKSGGSIDSIAAAIVDRM